MEGQQVWLKFEWKRGDLEGKEVSLSRSRGPLSETLLVRGEGKTLANICGSMKAGISGDKHTKVFAIMKGEGEVVKIKVPLDKIEHVKQRLMEVEP